MTKFTTGLVASLLASSASAFAPQQQRASTATAKAVTTTQRSATGFEEVGGVAFDPLGLAKLGTGESFDTFPNMFPNIQFLQEAEIKHGRQAMIAWTGIWATHQVRYYYVYGSIVVLLHCTCTDITAVLFYVHFLYLYL